MSAVGLKRETVLLKYPSMTCANAINSYIRPINYALGVHRVKNKRVGSVVTTSRTRLLCCNCFPEPIESEEDAEISLDQDRSDEDWDHFTVSGNSVDVVELEEAEVDVFGEKTTGDFQISNRADAKAYQQPSSHESVLGIDEPAELVRMDYEEVKNRVSELLTKSPGVRDHGISLSSTTYPYGMPQRAIFCSRTLNLRSIQAIGYDMDYTLVHYDVNAWERRAYEYGMSSLGELGFPVEGLHFDPNLVIRGLIVDKTLGNIVKADRFGFVKRAMHGTRMMSAAEVRFAYGRDLVNLKEESRWVFLNTLFSVSEAVMYAQMVDRLDDGVVPYAACPQSYDVLYKLVAQALFRAHVEGKLKAEIMENPSKFVRPDPDLPQTLMDQRNAGKTLMLITNSDFQYTKCVMEHAFEKYMPEGQSWRSLFDYIIINARKPDFFKSNQSLYEIVTDDGLMRPVREICEGGVYCGGSAFMVQQALGIAGEEILYVGDHIYTDAALAKLSFRWRTCLIVRELELEVEAFASGRSHRQHLKSLLDKKERIGDAFNSIRLTRQRLLSAGDLKPRIYDRIQEMNDALAELLGIMEYLDTLIGPAISQDGGDFNLRWGYLSRAGVNDRSQLLKQIEKYADIYTSRVSNLLRYTPFVYLRSPAQSMAHDRPKNDDLVIRMNSDDE